MHDPMRGVPFVVDVVFALNDQRYTSRIVYIRLPDQVLEHNLRADQLVIPL